MTETTGNPCPRCNQAQMRISEQPDGSKTGICHSCGYQFSNPSPTAKSTKQLDIPKLLKTINEFAFIIAIIAMLISFSTLSSISSIDNSTKTSINTLNTQLTEQLNTLNTSLNSTNATITNHTDQIGFVINSINSISSTISNLQNLNTNISQAEQLISDINNTLSQLNNQYITQQSFLTNTNCTLKITEFPNQNTSDGELFANIEITISNSNTTLHDTLLKMYYENSVWNITGSNIIVTSSPPHNNYIEIVWIEEADEQNTELRLEWNTSSYTTQIDEDDLITSLNVNNQYFNFNIERDTDLSLVQ